MTSSPWVREAGLRLVRPEIAKDDAACCVAKRDDLGRLPIGFCGPDCVRRPRLVPFDERTSKYRPGGRNHRGGDAA